MQQLPEWLIQMDRHLVEMRDMVQSLAEDHVIIAEEFLPLTDKIKEMHGHLDQAMVRYHPDSKPEPENFRAADHRTAGQNKARGAT